MLAFPRSTRVPRRLALHVRALTTAAQNAGTLNPADPSGTPSPDDNTAAATRQRRTWNAKSSAECMVVYPWNGIRSSAEGLAIARAVQDKYGPAKEVIFPRDADCVNLFRHYFWLVYDSPDARERLPDASAQISVQVANVPRSDGDVGLEEMMRGLGLSMNENKDAPRESPPAPTETEASKDASDAPSGHKTIDVRVEWARSGPFEVLKRKRPLSTSLFNEELLPHFAATWLAFDGFSAESARGPHTSNLLRAREKWRKIASKSSFASDGDSNDLATAASTVTMPPPSQEPVVVNDDARTEPEPKPRLDAADSASETQTQQRDVPSSSREWVPILPLGTRRPTPAPSAIPAQNAASEPAPAPASTSTYLDPTHTTDAADAADYGNDHDGRAHAPPKPAAAAPTKISRRERILHLARQNARTPLPAPAEEPEPPIEAAEKVDDEESERHLKERTIRERLWRLVGGNY